MSGEVGEDLGARGACESVVEGGHFGAVWIFCSEAAKYRYCGLEFGFGRKMSRRAGPDGVRAGGRRAGGTVWYELRPRGKGLAMILRSEEIGSGSWIYFYMICGSLVIHTVSLLWSRFD